MTVLTVGLARACCVRARGLMASVQLAACTWMSCDAPLLGRGQLLLGLGGPEVGRVDTARCHTHRRRSGHDLERTSRHEHGPRPGSVTAATRATGVSPGSNVSPGFERVAGIERVDGMGGPAVPTEQAVSVLPSHGRPSCCPVSATLDPGRLSGPDAADLTGCSRPLSGCPWRERPFWHPASTSPACGVTAATDRRPSARRPRGRPDGSGPQHARGRHRLPELPGTEEALRSGTLSGPKVAELSGAAVLDPGSEGSPPRRCSRTAFAQGQGAVPAGPLDRRATRIRWLPFVGSMPPGTSRRGPMPMGRSASRVGTRPTGVEDPRADAVHRRSPESGSADISPGGRGGGWSRPEPIPDRACAPTPSSCSSPAAPGRALPWHLGRGRRPGPIGSLGPRDRPGRPDAVRPVRAWIDPRTDRTT